MNLRYLSITILVALTACKSYKADPIDLAQEEQQWAVNSRANTHGGLSLEDAKTLGLFLNADLMKQRVKLRHARNIKLASGWMQDPEISVDALRILESTASFKQLLSGSAGFTLPLSGLPRIEKQIAAQYEEVDYWTLKDQEAVFLAQLETDWYNLGSTKKKLELTKKRHRELEDEEVQLQGLHKTGEVLLVESHQATLRRNEIRHSVQELEQELQKQTQQIIKNIGLHPSSIASVRLKADAPSTSASVRRVSGDLTKSPQMLAQMAKYATAETELKADIRRQYPSVTLSPTAEREEDEKKLGFGLSFTLPIWNKNRESIARSSSARAVAKSETIALWHQLYSNAVNNEAQQRKLCSHMNAEFRHLQGDKEALNVTDQLHRVGESTLAELSELRQRVYSTQINLLDLANNLKALSIQSKYYNFN